MVNTFFSKRRLRWFIEKGYVDSWEDPRFPTLRVIKLFLITFREF